MFTASNSVNKTYRVKGSKFIGFLYPVRNNNEFEQKLQKVKNEYPDATHHCYAYRIDPRKIIEFFQDDGEPGGTAGQPILNQLRSYQLVNTTVIVVRYFGGTKLGTSGLIDAYGQTAGECINQAKLCGIELIRTFRITYPYSEENYIQQLKNHWNLNELDAQYQEKVTLTLGCPEKNADALEKKLKQDANWRPIQVDSLGSNYITKTSR